MAQLVVRNLGEEVVGKLKLRAAERGRSAEAELREILREALSQEPRRRSFRSWRHGYARCGWTLSYPVRTIGSQGA